MHGSVDGGNQDEKSVDTATWREEEEEAKVGMVPVTTASVDPGTVVVHLHNTPVAGTLIMVYSSTMFRDATGLLQK